MLADTILAERGGKLDRMTGGSVSALAGAIQCAQRFDLAPGVIVSAYAVRQTQLVSQIRALALCRLPFAMTWFECPGSDPIYDAYRTKIAPDALAPARVGALVETDESRQRGVMTFAWMHRAAGLSTCPLGCSFDWRDEPEEVECMERDSWRHSGLTEAQIDKRMLTSFRTLPSTPSLRGASDAQLVGERRRGGVIWSPHMLGFATVLQRQQGTVPGPGTPEWRAWGNDLSGEPNSLRCAILLLNSRNTTSEERVVVAEKLNKARVQRGKARLLDHTTVRIKLSQAMEKRAGSSGKAGHEPSKLHLVRGHFKFRKSGVYWWSDHPRGDRATGMLSQKYRLQT